MAIVDLAGGTGDIAFRIKRAGGGNIVVADINFEMLKVGRARAEKRGLGDGLSWLCANGETLPFADRTFDAVTCAFGIRNMTHIDRALADIRRILKPGGRFLCLEFSRLALPGISPIYDAYSFKVVPKLGDLVARDGESYRYLVESIRRFPDQDKFAGMMEAAGLRQVSYRNLTGGIAAMHSGWRV
jgi:demethylmenaquinone methyltransferase/2-methoxy-6-polyprenyl-1,4-benzoquinol methylase